MFPLDMMKRVMEAWTYGADPLMYLRMNAHLAACRRRHEAEGELLGRLIREKLLDNPHALTVVLSPDRILGRARLALPPSSVRPAESDIVALAS